MSHPLVDSDDCTYLVHPPHVILHKNTFACSHKNYIQIFGTAMGPTCAPSYASLVLGYLDLKLCDQIQEIIVRHKFEGSFKRFLDDIFQIWDEQDGSMETLKEIMDDLDARIKYCQ